VRPLEAEITYPNAGNDTPSTRASFQSRACPPLRSTNAHGVLAMFRPLISLSPRKTDEQLGDPSKNREYHNDNDD
jgi:hypothetical protein